MGREDSAYIFHGFRRSGAHPDPTKPLSNMAMLTLLQKDMSMPFTVSAFRDWGT
jgi:hypothetical protein